MMYPLDHESLTNTFKWKLQKLHKKQRQEMCQSCYRWTEILKNMQQEINSLYETENIFKQSKIPDMLSEILDKRIEDAREDLKKQLKVQNYELYKEVRNYTNKIVEIVVAIDQPWRITNGMSIPMMKYIYGNMNCIDKYYMSLAISNDVIKRSDLTTSERECLKYNKKQLAQENLHHAIYNMLHKSI